MSKKTGIQFEQELNERAFKGGINILEYELNNGDFECFDIGVNSNYQWLCASGIKDFNMRIDSTFSLCEHIQTLDEKISNYLCEKDLI